LLSKWSLKARKEAKERR